MTTKEKGIALFVLGLITTVGVGVYTVFYILNESFLILSGAK